MIEVLGGWRQYKNQIFNIEDKNLFLMNVE